MYEPTKVCYAPQKVRRQGGRERESQGKEGACRSLLLTYPPLFSTPPPHPLPAQRHLLRARARGPGQVNQDGRRHAGRELGRLPAAAVAAAVRERGQRGRRPSPCLTGGGGARGGRGRTSQGRFLGVPPLCLPPAFPSVPNGEGKEIGSGVGAHIYCFCRRREKRERTDTKKRQDGGVPG